MGVVLDELQVISEMDGSAILVRHHGTRRLQLNAAHGILTEWHGFSLTEDELADVLGKAREVRRDLHLGGPELARAVHDHATGAGLLPSTVLMMVFRNGPAIEGALLLCTTLRSFDDRDLDLLSSLREHILAALLKARLLQDLQSTSDKKSEVVRIAAHDLRSPLATIVAFLQLMAGKMRSERFDAEAAAQRIEGLVGVGTQGLRLMERLLDLSAIESGGDELRLEGVKLGQLLEQRVKAHREAARSKGIELHVSSAGAVPEVEIDPTRIAQVLDNLLGNALKYTYSGGAVHVHCEVRGAESIVSVRDTGQGLTREDLQQVFRSFKRLSAQPTGGEPSAGLGLAIAKTIVERHGGRIWVESEHGKGATFSFSLPRVG